MRAPSIAAGDQAVMVVGAGSNTKGRDRSAKIALALALSLDDNTESARRHTGRCSAIHGHDVPSSFRAEVHAGNPNPLPQEVAECVEVVLQNFGEAKADGLLSVAMRAIFM